MNTTFQATLNRKIDLVFMVDNSASMMPLQAKLLDQFPVFMNVLKMLPSGDGTGTGLPDIHVAVISSDTGPGKFDLSDRNCRFLGDGGLFQSAPRGTCTAPPINGGQTYLAASMNQGVKNYNGDISDAFTCIAALGDQGCGFEGQLQSVRWALDPINVPDGNQGFLRSDAFLAVILITNEDDCSVPVDVQDPRSDLVDPTPDGVAMFGPLVSYRCNEFGHLCNIGGTLQSPPRTGSMTAIQGCISNETPSGKLTHVADEVNFLKSLKPTDPNQIFVAAITGPVATPPPNVQSLYSIGPDAMGNQSVLHSCMQPDGTYADPSVRIQQWAEAFGNHGLVETICAPSFAPSLSAIAMELSKLLGPQCIGNNLVDTDLNTPGIQPECQVVDQYLNDQGVLVPTVLPSCASNPSAKPCWTLDVDAMQCPGPFLVLNPHRPAGVQLANGLNTAVACAQCIPGIPKTGCP